VAVNPGSTALTLMPKGSSILAKAYQKQLRLHVARLMMITEAGDVAHIAFSVGYESATQFSREYARMFGVSPAKDGHG
jgi:transcriptional regulator GlxA family with amidase domain